jgi:phosphoglycolate phosphatase
MLLAFDLDGTLIDSVRDLSRSASELVTSLGGRPLGDKEVGEMVGEGAALLVQRALAAAGLDPQTPDALAEFLRIYDRRLLETTTAYQGIPEALTIAARRARLAVLTNKPRRPTLRLLDALGLTSYFEEVVAGDGPLGRKPDPAGLQALAKGEAHVMLVGDSPIDARTAAAAGSAFGWARYGFSAPRFGTSPPDTPYVLERPSDLLSVLDRFAGITSGA